MSNKLDKSMDRTFLKLQCAYCNEDGETESPHNGDLRACSCPYGRLKFYENEVVTGRMTWRYVALSFMQDYYNLRESDDTNSRVLDEVKRALEPVL